jgi:hypothetical protein
VLPCPEESKANFAALQLGGEALMSWEHFKTMQQAGHAVTWNEFKQAIKKYHIPKGLMDRKMREFLALRQGSDMVYHYAQKFNSFASMEGIMWTLMRRRWNRFRDGSDGEFFERLNMIEPNNFYEMVNKAISQEDAMKKA